MFSIAGYIFSERRTKAGIKLLKNEVLLKLNEDLLNGLVCSPQICGGNVNKRKADGLVELE